MIIACYQLTRHKAYFNEYDILKAVFLFVLISWLTILSIIHALYYHFEENTNCMSKIAEFFAVFSLSTFAALVLLNFAPTVLLLFAYPVDISALIALHIALFYSASTVLAVFFNKIITWTLDHRSISHNLTKVLCMCKCKDCCEENSCNNMIKVGWCSYVILGTLIMVALLPLAYVCIILLYQFVVARSESNQIASENLAKYVPAIAIAIFGFMLNKGAFDKLEHKQRKEDKRNTALAQKIWKEYPAETILKVQVQGGIATVRQPIDLC